MASATRQQAEISEANEFYEYKYMNVCGVYLDNKRKYQRQMSSVGWQLMCAAGQEQSA